MLHSNDFSPAWWLKNSHLQTIAAKWLRRHLHVKTLLETLELPDGDFIDLAWTELPNNNTTKPIVVILHGLEGSKDSHYAKGMLNALKGNNWIGVLMHFRGCSGRENRQARSYHSGDTADITYFTEILQQRYQNTPLAIIGFSLGGNVLIKYLAEQPENPYLSAVSICAPLHLSSCSSRINKGVSKLYQKYLVDMLKHSAEKKIIAQKITHINQAQLANIRTIRDFDQLLTAPLNCFNDADDYYQHASGRNHLHTINTPCLILHAQDDPFLEHDEIVAVTNLPKSVRFEVSKHGGHVGFITGRLPTKPHFWLEQRVPQFIAEHL
ncbi:hydrolase [Colwelliaceae bacterium 6471]